MKKKRSARRNPDETSAAAALSEAFHGRPAKSVKEVEEVFVERGELAKLGRLISLVVWLDEDNAIEMQPRGVSLGASADGGQLYFVGGDQALDLAALKLDQYLPKDHLVVGQVQEIVYHTSKDFHDFAPMDYEHEFAEEGGELPTLNYDTLSRKFYLTGGSYQVQRPGIVN